MKLEERMANILRKTSIEKPKGKYKAALNRLVRAGIAVKDEEIYKLKVKKRVFL